MIGLTESSTGKHDSQCCKRLPENAASAPRREQGMPALGSLEDNSRLLPNIEMLQPASTNKARKAKDNREY